MKVKESDIVSVYYRENKNQEWVLELPRVRLSIFKNKNEEVAVHDSKGLIFFRLHGIGQWERQLHKVCIY